MVHMGLFIGLRSVDWLAAWHPPNRLHMTLHPHWRYFAILQICFKNQRFVDDSGQVWMWTGVTSTNEKSRIIEKHCKYVLKQNMGGNFSLKTRTSAKVAFQSGAEDSPQGAPRARVARLRKSPVKFQD